MSDQAAGTPRVYLARHGETEWTKSGQFTGRSDIPLTSFGEIQVSSTSKLLIGPGKLITPSSLAHVFVSPRKRAQRTFDLLFGEEGKRALKEASSPEAPLVETTEDIREWEYGIYEGKLTKEIRQGRKSRGLDIDREWDIWRDGCEEGESAAQVTERLDRLIKKIRAIQAPNMHGEEYSDVVLVAHGHILRAFAKRWLGYPLEFPLSMMLEPGAIGILSYQHHNVNEPAFLLGMGFPADQPVVGL